MPEQTPSLVGGEKEEYLQTFDQTTYKNPKELVAGLRNLQDHGVTELLNERGEERSIERAVGIMNAMIGGKIEVNEKTLAFLTRANGLRSKFKELWDQQEPASKAER